ncbi:MAG: efflux RND transporter periplasmic adaptor subunit [Myxococcales bacterium]|nr:efflux RND transporter periplasmic adaptor subunit [Myxococcales bacterium]
MSESEMLPTSLPASRATTEAKKVKTQGPEPSAAKPLVAGAVGLLLGVLGTVAVLGGGEADGVSEPAPAPSRVVRLTPQLATNARLAVEATESSEVAPVLDLVGTVEFDERRVADVGGRIEGRIVQMLVSVGDTVEEGQAVAQIESPALGEAMADLLAARARLVAARTGAARETSLRQRQLTTAVSVEDATATVGALDAEVTGAEQRLLALGLGAAELRRIEQGGAPPRRVTLRSPIAGEVIERFAHLGQVVSATEPILRVADLSSVWVMLEVYERDLSRVRMDDEVEILSEAYPGETFPGRVSYLDALIDERTRSAGVRIVVDNADRRLRPGHFVHALLTSAGEVRPAIMLSRRAIVQVDGQPTVFVEAGELAFEPRAIELGAAVADRVEVVAGLAAGERIVTEGAFALKSEMQR